MADDVQQAIAQKVADESLTEDQARRVAEAVAAAPSDYARRVLIEWPYSHSIHDPAMIGDRAKKFGAYDPLYQVEPTKQQIWDRLPTVGDVVKRVIGEHKRLNELIKATGGMTKVGKLAPEARQLIARRARLLAKRLTRLANELENM